MLLVFCHNGWIVMDEFTGQLYRAEEEKISEMTYSELHEILQAHAPEEWRETLKGISRNNYEQYKHHLLGTRGREKQTFPPEIEPFIEAVDAASHRTEPWFVKRAKNGNWELSRVEDYCHGGSMSEFTCIVPTSYFGGKSVNDMLFNDLDWKYQP